MQGSLRLGRIAGIEVSIHYTWLFAFVLVTWSLAQGFFPAMFSGFAPSTYWLLGALAALGLFGSVLFHELSHSLVARARGLSVQQFMNPDPPVVEPAFPVSEFVFDHALRRGQRAVLVADRDGRLLGLMSITDARDVPPELWASTPVGRVMTQAPLKTVGPDTDLSAALELLVGGSFHQLPVVMAGQVVGLLDRAHLLRSLQLRDELGLRAPGDGVGSRPSAASRART